MGIIFLSYLFYELLTEIWGGSTKLETWKIIAGMVGFFSVILIVSKAIKYLISLYISRVGESAKINLTRLITFCNVITFGFICVMATKAYQSD